MATHPLNTQMAKLSPAVRAEYDRLRRLPPSQRGQFAVRPENYVLGDPGQPVKRIEIHVTSGRQAGDQQPDKIWVRATQDKGEDDFPYHIEIHKGGVDENGRNIRPGDVTMGRHIGVDPAASGKALPHPMQPNTPMSRNEGVIAITLEGTNEEVAKNPEMMKSFDKVVRGIQEAYGYKLPVTGHSNCRHTFCPGFNFSGVLGLDQKGMMRKDRPGDIHAAQKSWNEMARANGGNIATGGMVNPFAHTSPRLGLHHPASHGKSESESLAPFLTERGHLPVRRELLSQPLGVALGSSRAALPQQHPQPGTMPQQQVSWHRTAPGHDIPDPSGAHQHYYKRPDATG